MPDDTFGGVTIDHVEPQTLVVISNRPGPAGTSGFSGFSAIGGGGGGGGSGFSSFSGYSGKSGWSGGSGPSGFSGFSSRSGFSGFSGLSAQSGFSGYSAQSGASGWSGFSGANPGPSGYSGFSGASGISGPGGGNSGWSGYSGFSSQSGFSGFSSQSGFSGFSSRSGFSGFSGDSGPSGYSAYSGFSALGTSGFSGFSGPGSSGFSGFSSRSGFSGFSGISGFSGSGGGATPGGTPGQLQYNIAGTSLGGTPGLTSDGSSTFLIDLLTVFQDNADATKQATFQLSGLAPATSVSITIPSSNSTTVVPATATANQFVTNINTAGTQVTAQPGFSGFLGAASFAQLDRTTTIVSETATLTIAANTKIKTTATGTLTTIAFSGGNNAAQARRLELDVTGGPYNLTIPTCRRLGQTGNISSLIVTNGYHEFSWEFINSEYVMADSVADTGLSGYSGFSSTAPGISGFSGYSSPGSSGFSGFSGANPGASGFSGFSGISGPGGGQSGFSGYSSPNLLLFNTQTNVDYTLVASDAASGVKMVSTAPHNLTIPLNSSVNFPNGTQIVVEQGDTGVVTIVPTGGVTLQGANKTIGQYTTAVLIKQASDTWFCAIAGGQSGYSGYSGPQGPGGGQSGFSGFSGGAGTTGTSGFSGFSGPQGPGGGASGFSGFSGFSGAPGTAQPFTFSTSVNDTDPGSGNLRFNNATFASITQIFVDNNNLNGDSITAWLDSLDDSTNPVKGIITTWGGAAGAAFGTFYVTGAVVDGTGYRKIPVTPIAQNGAVVTNLSRIIMSFARTGDSGYSGYSSLSGYSGYSSVSGYSGYSGNFGGNTQPFEFRTNTTDSDPGSGNLRANNVDFSLATFLYVDSVSFEGASLPSWITQINNYGTDTNRATVTLSDRSNSANFVTFVVNGSVIDGTGYYKIPVNWNAATLSTFAAGAAILLSISVNGFSGYSGYSGSPGSSSTINNQTAAYTTVLGDAGKTLVHTSVTAHTFSIDSNANVAYPIGTMISFINEGSGVLTVAIVTDTLNRGDGTAGTGSRTLAASSCATAIKTASTVWWINGKFAS